MRKLLFWLVLGTVLLSACSKNKVHVTEFSPQGEVRELQTFTVIFDRELAPEDILDTWQDADYIDFEPELKGRYKWLNPHTLLFSPTVSLAPSQAYQATIRSNRLPGPAGLSLPDEEAVYTFHTPFFSVTDADIYYDPIANAEHQMRVVANLHFRYPVSPENVRQHLEVTRDGKSVDGWKVTTSEPSTMIGVNIGDIPQTEEKQKFQLRLTQGLEAMGAKGILEEAASYELELPPIKQLAITGIAGGHSGETSWIELTTSQPVDPEKLRRYVETDPAEASQKLTTAQNRIRIEGSAAPGQTVQVQVKKGLPGLYGGKLETPYREMVPLADLEPYIGFQDNGLYLMRGGRQQLAIEAVNIPAAEMVVEEVFQNNLPLFFADNYEYGSLYDQGNDYRYRHFYTGKYGKELYREDLVFDPTQNLRQNRSLDLGRVLGQRFKGIFVVTVRSKEDYWQRESRLVSLSNIGLIAKRSKNQLMVFANTIGSAEPMGSARVRVLSTNNQILAQGSTNAAGIWTVPDFAAKTEGFEPAVVIVEKGDDFNFLDLQRANVEMSRWEVEGKRLGASGLDAYLYGDRDLYRPGETVHIAAVVRNAAVDIPEKAPFFLHIYDPSGRNIQSFNQELGPEGMMDFELQLDEGAKTGYYRAELLTGDEQVIETYRFSVESFMPDRIRVVLDGESGPVQAGSAYTVDVDADYLFGTPAANRPYEADVRLRHRAFESERYQAFNFGGYSATNTGLENVTLKGDLNADGEARVRYNVPGNIRSGGYLRGSMVVSVFDLGGRTVNRVQDFRIYPNPIYLGVKEPDRYYHDVDKSIKYSLVALNPADKPTRGTVTASLYRREWRTVLTEGQNGAFRYASSPQYVEIWKKQVELGMGPNPFSFEAKQSGDYELRFSIEGNPAVLSRRFYAYDYQSTTATSFPVDREGRVQIIPDKESYKPGQTARVMFVTPFRGKMLVTLEQNDVIEHRYVDVTKSSTELRFSLSETHMPNAYITATLFRPHAGTATEPTPFLVGHGFHSIEVLAPDKYELPVEIEVPAERVRPNTRQIITVKTAPERDIFVTLAAVDEGILQIKNYESPSPYPHFYAKRALEVATADIYPYLLPEVMQLSPAGGDEKRASRLNPIEAKRVELLAYWSGIRRTDSRGEVDIPIDLPQFNGEVRLMAVAVSGSRFGSAERPLRVTNDVVIEPALPRFLSPGDTLQLPVTFINTTDQAGDVRVDARASGPIELFGGGNEPLRLGSRSSEVASYMLVAKNAVGAGRVVFETSGMDKVKYEVEIGVRPAAPLSSEVGGGSIKAGETKRFSVPDPYLTGTQVTTVSVSNFPVPGLQQKLRSLLGYPYGCLEQTTSRAFPQLYLQDMVRAIQSPVLSADPGLYVDEAIRKITGMQQRDGFSYWPGAGRVHDWSSTFATHFLVEAQKAGYTVRDDVLENALDALVRIAADRGTYTYRYYEGSQPRTRQVARHDVIYALYVLAAAGRPETAFMNYYRSRPSQLTGDELYLLAGAYAFANDWPGFHALLPNSFEAVNTDRQTGYSFNSSIRANAIKLNVLLDVNPQHAQIPQIIQYLGRSAENIYSTQDKAWTFLALGKAARLQGGAFPEVAVRAGTDKKLLHTFSQRTDSYEADVLNGSDVQLIATGNGTTYYSWSTEGVRTDGAFTELDRNLSVRRNYFSRTGQPIGQSRFRQGDLIVCEIELKSGDFSVQNIAISDLIPAGFEIENPRLQPSADLAWIESRPGRFAPDYLDVRDDRLLLFTDIRANDRRRFYYLIRVVNPGSFRLAPIAAEAMYDPNYRSYHGGGTVRVSGR